ncbi:MAG: type II secretion system F family protein [Sedimentisphaerales bacterium]|jgi:type II secretory pathway component PulF|nr:type II secretion system F family protein [Sedimentisphaerales bacterium]
MPTYQYIAIDATGKKVTGTLTAESAYAARRQLRNRSIHPSSISEVTASKERTLAVLSFVNRPKKKHIIEVTRQLATLLHASIKLTDALSVMIAQAPDSNFRRVLAELRDRVVAGESFAETLRDYPNYFDPVYVSMVRVGEVTGNLATSLTTIASFMAKRQMVASKATTAMIYPVTLIVFCIAAVVILTTKVIPPVGQQIIRSGQRLPWITQQLMNVGHILTSWWVVVVIGSIFALVWAAARFCRTNRGAYIRDRILLSMPIFGQLIRQRVVSRFASTLSTLLDSGLPVAESLRVVAEVTGNVIMKDAVQKARERILAGADIATPLKDSGVISPAIAHMVSVGEKSGELERMLKNISEDLEASTDMVIERLGAAIEPLIIVTIALVIGLIAIATLLPILKMSNLAIR